MTVRPIRSATVQGEVREHGACDFEVGGRPKAAESSTVVRGEIARAMLYMADRYGVNVGTEHEELMNWHRDDPPETWEHRRAEGIEAATGSRNPYID